MSYYTKTIQDGYDDQIEVNVEEGAFPDIFLTVDDTQGSIKQAQAQLTPKKARKLARILIEAAYEAERG